VLDLYLLINKIYQIKPHAGFIYGHSLCIIWCQPSIGWCLGHHILLGKANMIWPLFICWFINPPNFIDMQRNSWTSVSIQWRSLQKFIQILLCSKQHIQFGKITHGNGTWRQVKTLHMLRFFDLPLLLRFWGHCDINENIFASKFVLWSPCECVPEHPVVLATEYGSTDG
jgi:hypothetical protein